MQLDEVNTETVYWDSKKECHCMVVSADWDDGASLIAEIYDHVKERDLTGHLFRTEACYLTISVFNDSDAGYNNALLSPGDLTD